MIETQKRIAQVVALRKFKGTSNLKDITNVMSDLAGYTAEEYDMKLGRYIN